MQVQNDKKRVTFLLKKEDYKKISDKAWAEKMSLSDYIRKKLLKDK